MEKTEIIPINTTTIIHPDALPATLLNRLPPIITDLGAQGVERFFTFFTDRIPNDNTREAYFRNVLRFFEWCQLQGYDFQNIKSYHVSLYLKKLEKHDGKAPATIKQHLAAIRKLYSWLVVGQIIPNNPAMDVEGPKHVVDEGKTVILDAETGRFFLESIDTSNVVGLRDRALISFMTFTFGRVSAAISRNVDHYFRIGKKPVVRLREKGGKDLEIPVNHELEAALDKYIDAAGIAHEKGTPLFRTARGKTKTLNPNRMNRKEAWAMIRRRAKDAGITAPIGAHSFRGTGITDYLINGGDLETAQYLAGHRSPRTTKLYDRRKAFVSVGEVERIRLGKHTPTSTDTN